MEKRPVIKLQLSQLDKIMEMSAYAAIIFLWILAIFSFFKMPDTIPMHFNAAGEVDSYGNKKTIFILPVIATVVFAGLTVLNRYPHIFNYLNKITEANAVYQYSSAVRTIRLLKLVIALLFTVIVLITFLTSVHIINGLGPLFLPFTIMLLLIPAALSIIIAFRKK